MKINKILGFQMVVVYLQQVGETELATQQKNVATEVEMRVVNVQEVMEFVVFVSCNIMV